MLYLVIDDTTAWQDLSLKEGWTLASSLRSRAQGFQRGLSRMVRFFQQINVAQITLNRLVPKPGLGGALGLGFAADTFRC